MLELMPPCAASAPCRRETEALARRFDGSGEVNIVRYDSSTARALGSEQGPTRVLAPGLRVPYALPVPRRVTSAGQDRPGPHRLVAQDTALSRRQHGFESRWGYGTTSKAP